MLNQSNYLSIQSLVTSNMDKYLPVMIKYKNHIQRKIILLANQQELNDVKYCRFNMNMVNKLALIGQYLFKASTDKSDAILYCICLAIGTIIKEYDWGTKYIQKDGMCEIAAKITY